MAYFSQEQKKEIQPKIKALLKEYGFKGSLSVSNYSTVILTVREGKEDIINNYNKFVDEYNESKEAQYMGGMSKCTNGYLDTHKGWTNDNYETGLTKSAKEFLKKAYRILNGGNYDNSDIMTDYFDVGWYSKVNFGNGWEKPYICK